MDWISGIQRAADYIEDHLTDDIDYAEIAGRAYSSVYHFCRVFGIVCGFTVGEYIRKRRLTLAVMHWPVCGDAADKRSVEICIPIERI